MRVNNALEFDFPEGFEEMSKEETAGLQICRLAGWLPQDSGISILRQMVRTWLQSLMC